ncbi:unnamed protein product [Adineta steineri]|uniref:Uncharacterized protein n=1 Tax=Adineta steineri TaxID=433720 RepID=A0A813SYM7_9BILA|nr:unnamed protein product [Adineta steineri]CAF0918797.1 unnamed protein product [Adineta steineri]
MKMGVITSGGSLVRHQQQAQHHPLQPQQQVSLPAPLQPRRLVQHQQQAQHHPLRHRQQVLQQAVRLHQQVPQLVRPRQRVLHQPVQLRQQVPQPVRPRRQVLQQQVLHHLRVQHQRQRQRQVLQPQHQRQQRQQVSFRTYDYSFVSNIISLSIAPPCGTAVTNPSGQILSLPAGSAKTTYTQYTYGFTANDLSSTLSFIITGEGGAGGVHYWLLDAVSVNHTNVSTNVLINGDFESGNLNGWTQYCNTTANCDTASSGNYAHTVTSPCYAGTYCVYDSCKNTDYLEQSFSTVVGDHYFISYYIRIEPDKGGPLQIYVTLT